MAKRVSEGKATEKDKNTTMNLIKTYLGPTIRHGITAAGAFFATKGLPQLNDGTVENLTDLVLAAVLLLGGIGWSYAEKHLRAKKA